MSFDLNALLSGKFAFVNAPMQEEEPHHATIEPEGDELIDLCEKAIEALPVPMLAPVQSEPESAPVAAQEEAPKKGKAKGKGGKKKPRTVEAVEQGEEPEVHSLTVQYCSNGIDTSDN